MTQSKVEDFSDRAAKGNPPDPETEFEPVPKPEKLPRLHSAIRSGIELMSKGAPANPVLTGFVDVDDKIRHFGPKEVTMLAADSGIGKSTVAMQTTIYAAASGHGVVYLNLEMSEDKFGLRTVAGLAEVPTAAAATGQLTPEHWQRMQSAVQALGKPSKRVVLGNAREHRTTAAIKALCERAKGELEAEGTPLRVVIVDHVLQILVKARSDDRDGAGKERADLLKDLAESLGVHVFALVHVTRDASKGGRMPTKNELASSAWFDRHADNIFIFHQKRNPDGTFVRDVPAMLSCQKCRWGEPFMAELTYKGGWFWPWRRVVLEGA